MRSKILFEHTCILVYLFLLFYRFLFVVEMEMTILGSRHFLITTTQNGSKSPKLRYFVVEKFLSSL